MKAKGLTPADVAGLFGVKPPSVYDWINFGRIAKKHLPRLVEVFGHSVDWWITGVEISANAKTTGMPAGIARLAGVLEGRSDEEMERIARALELLLGAQPSTRELESRVRRYTIDDEELAQNSNPRRTRRKKEA